jgi:hypothetical protein
MVKLITAISAAALLAAAAVLIPGTAPVQAHAFAGNVFAGNVFAVKGDRLDAHDYGRACSQRGWPYFEASCLRDTTSPVHNARAVRVIALDRVADAR